MAMSGSLDSKKDGTYGGYWRFSWTAKKTSTPGKTTVSWTLSSLGRSASPKWLATQGEVVINGVTYNLASFSEESNLVDYSQGSQKTGSFTLTHAANGTASFTVKFSIEKIYSTATKGDTTNTWSLDTNYPYSQCGAPTSVWGNLTLQKPGGKITVSWSGAQSGTANAIKNYTVEYKIEGASSWSSAGSTSGTGTSLEFTIPSSATRGKKVMARVKTIGSASGYDSGWSSSSGVQVSKVNTLPSAPTLSASAFTIPSNGGTVSLTISHASHEGQTISYKYATSASGTKTACTANFSKQLTNGCTYYFWSNDGLEDSSSYSTCTVTKNTRPGVTSLGYSDTSDLSGTQTITIHSSKTGAQIRYYLGYKLGSGNTNWLLENSTASSYLLGDIRYWIAPESAPLVANTSYNYTLVAKVYDGVEMSEEHTIVKSFSVPDLKLFGRDKMGRQINSYFGNEFILKMTASSSDTIKFYKNIALENSHYDLNTASGGTSFSQTITPTSLAWETNLNKIQFNAKPQQSGGVTIFPFYVTPSQSAVKVTPISIIPSSGLTSPFGSGVYHPYSTSQLNISILGHTGPHYGIDSGQWPTLTISYGADSIEVSSGAGTDNNTFNYYIDGKAMYTTFFGSEDLRVKRNRLEKINLNLKLENKFGQSFSKSFELPLSFNDQPTINKNLLFPGYTKPNERYDSLSNFNALKEGMPIYGDIEVFAFDQPILELTALGFLGNQTWLQIDLDPVGQHTEYAGYNVMPWKYKYKGEDASDPEKILSALPAIGMTHHINIVGTVTTTHAKVEKVFYSSLPVVAHTNPSGYFSSAELFQTGEKTQLKVQATCESSGYSAEDEGDYDLETYHDIIGIECQEVGETFDVEWPGEPADDGYYYIDIPSNWSIGEYSYLHFRPIYYSRVGVTRKDHYYFESLFPTEKESVGGAYSVVYNLAPTISYRKNRVGINITPVDTAVVHISETSSKHAIYLDNSEYRATINLNGGENSIVQTGFSLEGCYIDCGEWA